MGQWIEAVDHSCGPWQVRRTEVRDQGRGSLGRGTVSWGSQSSGARRSGSAGRDDNLC